LEIHQVADANDIMIAGFYTIYIPYLKTMLEKEQKYTSIDISRGWRSFP
jgi:hypothetical protein